MTEKSRVKFEDALERTLQILRQESPISPTRVSQLARVDRHAIDRVLAFLVASQERFAATSIRVVEGKWGKVVWRRDRLEKMKLPEDVREWYIKTRFFEQRKTLSAEEHAMAQPSETESRASVEDVILRLFAVLEYEDDLTVAELARRTASNRRTVDKALDIILKFQDAIAEGILIKKNLLIWRKRPELHELDKTTMTYILKKWYFPELVKEIPDDGNRELLLAS